MLQLVSTYCWVLEKYLTISKKSNATINLGKGRYLAVHLPLEPYPKTATSSWKLILFSFLNLFTVTFSKAVLI